MGEIRSVECKACRAKWQCMEGVGLLYGKKENIIAAFSEHERAAIAARMESSKIPAYDFSFQLAVCSHCQNVVSVPTLAVGDGETCVGACPVCGKKTKKPISELKRTACPVCKSKTLQARTEGYWD